VQYKPTRIKVESFLEKADWRFDKKAEQLHLVLISILAFLTPALMGYCQVVGVVGTGILLTFAAIGMRGRNIIPVILLPPLGLFFFARLFGIETGFSIEVIPILWIVNFVYVSSFKYLNYRINAGYWEAGIGASLLQALILLCVVNILVYLGISTMETTVEAFPEEGCYFTFVPSAILELLSTLIALIIVGLGKELVIKRK